MFSSRVPSRLDSNALSRAANEARGAGRQLIDLTLTNPTRARIAYPDGLLEPLAKPEGESYCPQAFGLDEARQAAAADYARRGIDVPWERVILTASTSEAYSLLFKLLCAPSGDSVMTPVPSYPLFEHLTRLDGVAALPYAMEYHGRWSVSIAALEAAWTGATRAVLAVSPNNPTGSVLTPAELTALDDLCASRDAAVIIDEVFADYALDPDAPPIRNATEGRPKALTFRLGGLSKSAALPQVKLGWVAVDGPPALVDEAMARLELICDTYLSVSTPVQVAAADLIDAGHGPRSAVQARTRANYARLRALSAAYPSVDVLHADAGWSAVIRVAARGDEEEIVLRILQDDGVLVHPGFFFDFAHEAYLVVSLLPEEEAFAEGIRRVLERVDG